MGKKQKKEGGQAFPKLEFGWFDDGDGGVERKYFQRDGMTIRDYFAAKAMQAVLSAISDAYTSPSPRVDIRWIAEDSYHMADAMLKAREE